jgi:hypothetical protein
MFSTRTTTPSATSGPGRHAGEKNVANDSAGPDVALGVVVLVENFWSDVVRGSKFLIEILVRFVHKRSSEVDDLDLIKLLVLLEENILRLEVSVNDVVLMAVVDAGKDLLHQDRTVSLGKLAALQDLVEELSSLADISDEVVALLVLKELVHLDDVWVIDFF